MKKIEDSDIGAMGKKLKIKNEELEELRNNFNNIVHQLSEEKNDQILERQQKIEGEETQAPKPKRSAPPPKPQTQKEDQDVQNKPGPEPNTSVDPNTSSETPNPDSSGYLSSFTNFFLGDDED